MKPWNILGWIIVVFVGICILMAIVEPRTVTCTGGAYQATCVRS